MSGRRAVRWVVVAVDGSPSSLRAVRLSAEIADALSASLSVVHVVAVHEVPILMAEAEDEEALKLGQVVLSDALSVAREYGVTAKGVLLHGGAAAQILRYVRTHPADLLVLGTRGLRAARGMLMGSVSQSVGRRAKVQVVLVR